MNNRPQIPYTKSSCTKLPFGIVRLLFPFGLCQDYGRQKILKRSYIHDVLLIPHPPNAPPPPPNPTCPTPPSPPAPQGGWGYVCCLTLYCISAVFNVIQALTYDLLWISQSSLTIIRSSGVQGSHDIMFVIQLLCSLFGCP